MAEYLIQDSTLTDIADAIRAKTGGSSAMTPAEMVTEIAAIPSGGGGVLQADNWQVYVGTVTQVSQGAYVNINIGVTGTLIHFVSFIIGDVSELPEFPEGVTSQIIGHTYRNGGTALPGSTVANVSMIYKNDGTTGNFVTGATATLNSNGVLSFGNKRGSQALPNVTFKYVAVIEVSA